MRFTATLHGFRRNFCVTRLLHLTNVLISNLRTRNPTVAVFRDLAEAFHRAAHNLLLLKLSELKINSLVLTSIEPFLLERRQFCHNNDTPYRLPCLCFGILQETVLGLLLFLICINDVHLNLSSYIRLTSGNCVIYEKITSLAVIAALQAFC